MPGKVASTETFGKEVVILETPLASPYMPADQLLSCSIRTERDLCGLHQENIICDEHTLTAG